MPPPPLFPELTLLPPPSPSKKKTSLSRVGWVLGGHGVGGKSVCVVGGCVGRGVMLLCAVVALFELQAWFFFDCMVAYCTTHGIVRALSVK